LLLCKPSSHPERRRARPTRGRTAQPTQWKESSSCVKPPAICCWCYCRQLPEPAGHSRVPAHALKRPVRRNDPRTGTCVYNLYSSDLPNPPSQTKKWVTKVSVLCRRADGCSSFLRSCPMSIPSRVL